MKKLILLLTLSTFTLKNLRAQDSHVIPQHSTPLVPART